MLCFLDDSLLRLVLAGPPDDSCGLFAGELLAGLGDEFKGRLFVCTKLLGSSHGHRLVAHVPGKSVGS